MKLATPACPGRLYRKKISQFKPTEPTYTADPETGVLTVNMTVKEIIEAKRRKRMMDA